MDKYKFGEYIYNKRKKLGLTQDELGKLIGVTNKAVSKWEVGETMPDVLMLKSLANVLGVTVDELLTQQDLPEKQENIIIETPNNKRLIITFVIICSLLIISIIVLISLYLNAIINDQDEQLINVTNENIQEIININPSSQIICNEETLEIFSTYELNENYSFNNDTTLSFTVVYQYIYYYYLKDGTVGVVTYYNRFYDIDLNSNNNITTINVLLEPKFNIDDFKGFKQVEISYIILNSQGSVVKNEGK